MAKPRLVIDGRESGTSTGRYVDKLIEYLAELKPGLDIEVLTKSARIGVLEKLAPDFKISVSDFKEFTFAEQLGFKAQLSSLRADLVHFSMTQQPVRYHGKKITTIHDLTTIRFNNPSKNWLVYKFKQRVYKAVIKKVVMGSSAIITPSHYVKNDLVNFSRVDPAKVHVIYEAADKITAPAEAVQGLRSKQFIMYVGRPQPHKNLYRLVEAFEALLPKYPDMKLVLAGRSDVLYARLQKTVDHKQIKNVVFTGHISEEQLRWLYENTAVYAFPSLSEGFGLPGLEAMAHGAPVAASNATCLPEIYGPAAHYFDPTSVSDIADKISEILDSSDLQQRLIASGHEQLKKYSWAKMAEQTLRLYQEVLKI